jgi:hypothetical protein
MDGLKTTSVDINQNFVNVIVYDLGEDYRLEAYSVLGEDSDACVYSVQLQYAKYPDAPDSEWRNSGPNLFVQKSETVASTSQRFDPPIASRFWRLKLLGNHNNFKALFYTVLSEVQVSSPCRKCR